MWGGGGGGGEGRNPPKMSERLKNIYLFLFGKILDNVLSIVTPFHSACVLVCMWNMSLVIQPSLSVCRCYW